MPGQAFEILSPESRTTCAVFASPHSGRDYPWDFIRGSQLDELTIRSSEDAFVDMLFDQAPEFGAPLIRALAPRAYLDLNRSADELDPALIQGVRQVGHNPRISSGLGVIPRVVANGREIQTGKMRMGEARLRLAKVYHPYHENLQRLLSESIELFGQVVLFDCHSMPREALTSAGLINEKMPDVVIGDRYGASCASAITAAVEEVFQSVGMRTSRNKPFAGAYIAKHYGRPSQNQHVLQIEIDRSLYMDEQQIVQSENFAVFREAMQRVTQMLAELGRNEQRVAAE